ncbi:MAG: hypothetical protein H0W84_11125, partial [Bacteroidetes bacterium]|nr:hypothetical protein [Bacteroidota bacterium]
MKAPNFNYPKKHFFRLIAGLVTFIWLSSFQVMGQACAAGTTAATTNPVCSGGTTVLSVSGATAGVNVFQWYRSLNGGAYASIAG